MIRTAEMAQVHVHYQEVSVSNLNVCRLHAGGRRDAMNYSLYLNSSQ